MLGARRQYLRYVPILAWCCFLCLPQAASSQDSDGLRILSEAPRNTLALGVSAYAEEFGRSQRLGVWWYGSNRLGFGLSAELSDTYDVVEGEARWFLRDSGVARPFVAASGLWQTHTGREGIGAAAAVGGEVYLFRWVAWSVAVGWRSLYQWSNVGQLPVPDNHSFRLTIGLAAYPWG